MASLATEVRVTGSARNGELGRMLINAIAKENRRLKDKDRKRRKAREENNVESAQ